MRDLIDNIPHTHPAPSPIHGTGLLADTPFREGQEGTSADQSELLFPDDPESACYAHFGWAYTTLATPPLGVGDRLLFPLIAVNQAWYRYRRLRRDLVDMSFATHGLTTDRDLIAQTEFFNEAVLDVMVWEAEREGIDHLRDFLDRKYSVKLATRESTQARILFVIAIFQLLSVFGLASGYLYFWEKTPLPETAIFDSPLVVWATILSPIVVLVVIAWLLVSFFRRHC